MTGLFQLLLLVSSTLASEPSCLACSKYEYEEKVLERMIRMEFTFEKVLNENKAVGKTVVQDLTRIKEENERLHATVDALKEQQEQAERRLISQMKEVERNQSSTLEHVVTESNNILKHISEAFNEIKDQVIIPAVFFHARSAQSTALTTGEVIMYKTVETNQGNGYSSTTGKFTAPSRGLYLFFMHTFSKYNKFSYLKIVKEGSVLIACVHYDKNDFTCSSSQVFVQLDAGESVWVQSSNGGSNVQLYDAYSYWISFGGAIVCN